jgi:hypothetical protein
MGSKHGAAREQVAFAPLQTAASRSGKRQSPRACARATWRWLSQKSVGVALLCTLLVIPTLAARAAADGVSFGPHDVRSVFHVAKSENGNQVHYALRLSDTCQPLGKQPAFAYWRRARTKGFIEAPLEGMGRFVYGASDDQVVESGPDGTRVRFYVKALERVSIEVHVQKGPSGCTTSTTTTLSGKRIRLSYAFVQLGGLGLRVKYVDVVGYGADGVRVTERMRPQ